MASIVLSQYQLNIPASSGQTVIQVLYNECDPLGAYLSNGLNNATCEMNRLGDLVVITWGENTLRRERTATLTVEAWDGNMGGTIHKECYITQSAESPAEVNVQGPTSIQGEEQSVTLTVSSTVPGGFVVAVNGNNPWVTVENISQTTNYTGVVVLHFSENNSDSRSVTISAIARIDEPPYEIEGTITITQARYVQPEPEGSTLYYSPSSSNVTYAGGTHTSPAPVMMNVGNLSVTHSGNMDIDSVRIDGITGVLVISYGANTGDSNKSETFTVTGVGNAGNLSTTYTLYQGGYTFAVNPIWKTTTVDITGKAYVNYTISCDGVTVYSGRAYQMPGENDISFELNEIVRDYVDNYLWWREGYQTPSGWQRTFTMETEDGATGDYVFTKDWSYKELNYSSNSVICLNDPIIDEVPSGAYVPICVFSPSSNASVGFTYTPGSATSTAYTVNLDNPRQARYLFTATDGYKYGFTGGGKERNSIYKGVSPCKTRYVLYYENAFGGFDALAINGISTASDKIAPYTMRNAVRVPSTDFSYRRYLNDITKTWEFKTGYLSDLQASKMYHLIESTMVYLYDTATNELFPVVIDDTSVTYKTYSNQGRKFFNYTFKCQESQNKIRK